MIAALPARFWPDSNSKFERVLLLSLNGGQCLIRSFRLYFSFVFGVSTASFEIKNGDQQK
jgi:hypothetical protein